MSWPDSRDSRFSSGDLPGSASSTSPRNSTERGLQASRYGDPEAAACRNYRALEQHRSAIGDAGIGRDGRRRLVDRRGLAGERRLVGGEVGCFDQSHVRRDRIAAFDEHDVARHQLLGGNHAGVSTSAHARRSSAESLQRLDGARGLDLGQKADQAIEPENGCDRGRLLAFAEVERQRRRGG